MSRRIVAALAACGALLTAPNAVPAQAESPDAGTVVARADSPLIQGVVVDQRGRAVDDVKVQALDEEGTVAASALTYASDREDGPQHGYFFLEVPRGTYTVKISKAGYRTAVYDAGRITRRVRKISLGEIEIKKLPAATTTKAELKKATVTTRDHGIVIVTVSSKSTDRPTGKIQVREGRKLVGSGVLRKGDRGTVDVVLDKLDKGDHQLRASFLGSADLKPSDAKALTLHVVKKKR